MLDAAFDVQFGGYYVGDTGWNVQIRSPRPYFKIYHQRLGELELSFANGQTYHLAADRVALLSAFDLRAQRASSVMEHCWMHFLPASPRLTHRRSQGQTFNFASSKECVGRMRTAIFRNVESVMVTGHEPMSEIHVQIQNRLLPATVCAPTLD